MPENGKKGLMGKLGVIRILITVIILAGVGVHTYFVYDAARSLEVVDKRIDSLTPLGGDEYEIRFTIVLKNPKNTAIDVDYLKYKVYVEGDFIGEGEKMKFSVNPGEHDYEFSLRFRVSDLSKAAANSFLLSKVRITLRGTVEVPLKFLGLFTYQHVELPYETSEDVSIR